MTELGAGVTEVGVTGLCCVWVVEGVWEAETVLGAVLGEIPAAGRGYDGAFRAGMTERGRVWRSFSRGCDGAFRAGVREVGVTGLCCVWVVEGVWEAETVLGAVLGEIPAAGRGYDGAFRAGVTELGAGMTELLARGWRSFWGGCGGAFGAGVRKLGAGVAERGRGTGLSGR